MRTNIFFQSTIKSHPSARQHQNVLRGGSARRNSRDSKSQKQKILS